MATSIWPASSPWSGDQTGPTIGGMLGSIALMCGNVTTPLGAAGTCTADQVINLGSSCNVLLNYATQVEAQPGAVASLEAWCIANVPAFSGMTVPQVDSLLGNVQTSVINLRAAVEAFLASVTTGGFLQAYTYTNHVLTPTSWTTAQLASVSSAITAFRALVT